MHLFLTIIIIIIIHSNVKYKNECGMFLPNSIHETHGVQNEQWTEKQRLKMIYT